MHQTNTDNIDESLHNVHERLLALNRRLAAFHERILAKTDRLAATNTHLLNTQRSQTRTLTQQSSSINNTQHIVTAQARTLGSQAQKLAAQQDLIELMQRDIFRLSRWHTESKSRINAHDGVLEARENDIRELSAGLDDHIRFFEYIEKETYWMNVYARQTMLIRATELERASTTTTTTTNDDEQGATASVLSTAMDEDTCPIVIPQHILLDRIVVHMVKEHAPERLQKVFDGFEVVHGISLHSYEDVISREMAETEE
jgi:hypothetical protein